MTLPAGEVAQTDPGRLPEGGGGVGGWEGGGGRPPLCTSEQTGLFPTTDLSEQNENHKIDIRKQSPFSGSSFTTEYRINLMLGARIIGLDCIINRHQTPKKSLGLMAVSTKYYITHSK